MTVRLGGMASSLDTESIIKSLIDARSAPITALTNKISAQQEVYSAWTQVDTCMSQVQTDASLLTSYSSWSQMAFNSNNESVVSGTVSGSNVGEKEFTVNVVNLARAHQYKSNAQSSSASALGLAGEFTVNGQNISVESSDSISSIAQKINDKSLAMSGAGVSASIIGKSLVLSSKKTGTDNAMTVAYSSGDNILSSLGLSDAANETTALNLKATINNVDVESASNTKVTSLVDGITFNFKSAGSATVSTSHDTANIKTLIENFVSSYNDAMSYLADQTKVKVNSSSNTVSDVGVLQGDSLANNIKSKCRSILTSVNKNAAQVNQNFNSLQSVGIWFKSEANELSIVDSDKLDAALNNNFDEVMALFRSYGSGGSGDGIFRRFSSYVADQTDPATGSITNRENNLTSRIAANEKHKAKLQSNLASYEVDLWQHFSNMESAVNSVNSSTNYLLSSLGLKSK